MRLSQEAVNFLNGETDPNVEKQMRHLGFGWAYDLRRRWKEIETVREIA